MLLNGRGVVVQADGLEGTGRVVVHEPEPLVVEQQVVVARQAGGPVATADRNHPHVLAGVDVGRVGVQLVADVVAERLTAVS